MRDPRVKKLAENLIDYSVELQPGEKILIEVIGGEVPLARELIRKVYEVGGMPFLTTKDRVLWREILKGATKEQMEMMAHYEAERMKDMDAYIGIRAGKNVNQWADIPGDKMNLYMEYFNKPVHFDIRVPKTKWCVLRYPNDSMAQLANMSTEAFEDFYFNVCNLDYAKMSKAMDNLIELMDKTDEVRIIGPGTDLTFSIAGIKSVKCDGKRNIPDGEIFTAPVRDSVNGVITYNVPAVYQGFTFENIRLEFKDGKIIKAEANDTERINKIFDTDEGARYIGEFALGVNPYILNPMKDTLFDEKINGSFHFTPGGTYDECDNGNRSAIHWDLVCIQRPEYGGGEIYFDGRLIRKDGRFVVKELESLNPENLK
ncbi:aminopeptidase [Anoxybacter fermentans]|uniref:Aminopeptidase n=1 Tax=Anoxybacter fermentans TaxID=1323375 RepID=A0A3Q9HQD4_9FIRM|nr:aminopeptidase [Anoxybacter fermentans]AZR73054.1 aminopeptidase [Anoxybacter fermentans]